MSMTRRPTLRLIGYAAAALLAAGGVLAPTGPARAGGSQRIGSVPDTAFLSPEDTGGNGGARADADLTPYLRPPLPCADRPYRSQRARRAEGTRLYQLPTQDFHTVLVEHITGYRGDGATRYLAELNAALAGGCTDGTGRWSVVGRGGPAGRDSLLVRLRRQIEDYGGNPKIQDTYVSVARTGRIVVVLADLGWETGSGHPDTVTGLAGPAVRRAAASVGVPARYREVRFRFAAPGTRTWAESMNERGQVVGQWEVRTDVFHPFLWQNGRVTDLGVLAPGPNERGMAVDINIHGDVVGASDGADGRQHATLWRRGRIIALPTPSGESSFANTINDRGQIAGTLSGPSGELRPVIWENGRVRELGFGAHTLPFDLNNRGQLVGWTGFGVDGAYHAFLWQHGRVTKLPRPQRSYPNSVARDVNERGEIVGSYAGLDDSSHALRWYRGTMTELGTLSTGNASAAGAVNDLGQVVGAANIGPHSLEDHPFLYSRGVMWDLSRLGFVEYADARLIDNHGRILSRTAVYTPVWDSSWQR